jgi:hypothetical protein
MHDPIASIKALAGWLSRDPKYGLSIVALIYASFEINDENMKILAHISDKYIIDALRKDLRVWCLLSCTN